jgi:hypothetical protein
MIKKAVVKEDTSPSVEDGKPCKYVVNGEPVMTKEAAQELKLPKIEIQD